MGCATFGLGTGALGRSFTTRSGSGGFGRGCGSGGAICRKMRGSTCIFSLVRSFVRGAVFGASRAPGGRRIMICRRARSSCSCEGGCGGKSFGSKTTNAMTKIWKTTDETRVTRPDLFFSSVCSGESRLTSPVKKMSASMRPRGMLSDASILSGGAAPSGTAMRASNSLGCGGSEDFS